MINALLDGEAITFSRFELPPDHPQAAPHGGNPTDTLELGADDVLRPEPKEFWAPSGLTARDQTLHSSCVSS